MYIIVNPFRRYLKVALGGGVLVVLTVGLFSGRKHHVISPFKVSLSNKTTLPSREELMQRFPVCFPPRNNYTSIKKIINGIEGKFILWGDNHRSRPGEGGSYDHTCFIIKARYNCALPPGSNRSRAEDYKFVYRHRDEEEDKQQLACDLDDVIGRLGGPAGLGRALAQLGVGKPSKAHYQVLLQGDSRLRQLIESLLCRYKDQVTNLTLAFASPDLGIDSIQLIKKTRNVSDVTHILQSNETSQPRSIGVANESDCFMSYRDLQRKGCHGNGKSRMSKFYYPGVPVPKSIDGCSDDFLMVEFGNMIQFYYIYRPYLYSNEALLTAYKKLGMTIRRDPATGFFVLDDIDVLLWNLAEESVRLLAPEREKSMISYNWEGVQVLMGEIQKKTIGTYFGAKNPFVKTTDKYHACMPGYPDDMVNIMLFSLMGGLTSRSV